MDYSKMTIAEIDAEIEKIESEYDNAPAMLKCSLVWKHRDLYEAKAERWEEIARRQSRIPYHYVTIEETEQEILKEGN